MAGDTGNQKGTRRIMEGLFPVLGSGVLLSPVNSHKILPCNSQGGHPSPCPAWKEVIMGRKADRAGEGEHLILAPNKEMVCHSSLISETNQV